ncbi:hypothetical protein BGX27_003433, partial [Mortierella sp. AM989]
MKVTTKETRTANMRERGASGVKRPVSVGKSAAPVSVESSDNESSGDEASKAAKDSDPSVHSGVETLGGDVPDDANSSFYGGLPPPQSSDCTELFDKKGSINTPLAEPTSEEAMPASNKLHLGTTPVLDMSHLAHLEAVHHSVWQQLISVNAKLTSIVTGE